VAGPPSRARRVSRTGVGGAASRGWHRPRRTVPHSGGDGFPPRELVRQDRGASPRRMMAPPCHCQNNKCLCPRTGLGVRVRNALERGGACSRAARTLERGGARLREAFSLERDGARPREVCARERGGACARGSSSGPPWRAVGAAVAWATPCMFKRDVFSFGFLQVSSGVSLLFKGTPRAVPDSSPRASTGLPARLLQMLEPTDRTSFSPGLRMLSEGPHQPTRGSSPRSPVGA
jgi:hypothetical protein